MLESINDAMEDGLGSEKGDSTLIDKTVNSFVKKWEELSLADKEARLLAGHAKLLAAWGAQRDERSGVSV